MQVDATNANKAVVEGEIKKISDPKPLGKYSQSMGLAIDVGTGTDEWVNLVGRTKEDLIAQLGQANRGDKVKVTLFKVLDKQTNQPIVSKVSGKEIWNVDKVEILEKNPNPQTPVNVSYNKRRTLEEMQSLLKEVLMEGKVVSANLQKELGVVFEAAETEFILNALYENKR